MHDVIRYTHEQAVQSMFGLTDEADEVRSIELKAKIPLELRLIDLGGGLKQGLTTCNDITPEQVESMPFRAIWKGFTHPGVSWEGSIGLNMDKMLTLLSASATSEFGPAPGGTSYAILSGEYMNLSAKFGYHFATVDAFVGSNSGQNYVSLQFSGGAGSYYGKSLRVAFLGSVLRKLGFQVKLRGDLIEGSITDYDRLSLEDHQDRIVTVGVLHGTSARGFDGVEDVHVVAADGARRGAATSAAGMPRLVLGRAADHGVHLVGPQGLEHRLRVAPGEEADHQDLLAHRVEVVEEHGWHRCRRGGLWAPSTMTSGLCPRNSKRPGIRTSAKASSTTSWPAVRRKTLRPRSTAALALSPWCRPWSGR